MHNIQFHKDTESFHTEGDLEMSEVIYISHFVDFPSSEKYWNKINRKINRKVCRQHL